MDTLCYLVIQFLLSRHRGVAKSNLNRSREVDLSHHISDRIGIEPFVLFCELLAKSDQVTRLDLH